MSQVIVHHNHNLLVGDAILVDNLLGMASIGLVPVAVGDGHNEHPVFCSGFLLGEKANNKPDGQAERAR